MNNYVLVSDSTADLPAEVVKKMGIKILPFSYSIDDEIFYYNMNGDETEAYEFYDKLKNGAMPVTSQINPNFYKEFFEEIVKEGKNIVYICFSSGLSGSYQSVCLAVSMLEEKYPDVKISIIDSKSASIGEGILLYQAYTRWQSGFSMEELTEWIINRRENVPHWFMVEDLFHLKRGGRVSTVEAMVGTALKIKPILSVDEDGKLVVKSKARGVNKALDFLVGKVKEYKEDLSDVTVLIGQADAMDNVEVLKKMLIEAGVKEENILVAPIGAIIGTHVGIGMTAVTFTDDL